MMTVHIVPFDNAVHRSEVMALWRVSFGYETAHNEPGLVIDKKRAVKDDLLLVAVLAGEGVDGAVVGAVVGTVMAGYDGHRGWLYSVAVSPDYRKRGIGNQLVSHAEGALVNLGCRKINLQILQSNAGVTAFMRLWAMRSNHV